MTQTDEHRRMELLRDLIELQDAGFLCDLYIPAEGSVSVVTQEGSLALLKYDLATRTPTDKETDG